MAPSGPCEDATFLDKDIPRNRSLQIAQDFVLGSRSCTGGDAKASSRISDEEPRAKDQRDGGRCYNYDCDRDDEGSTVKQV